MHQDWILWGVLPPYLRRTLSRRDAVRLLSVAGAASLAGCGGGGHSGRDNRYDDHNDYNDHDGNKFHVVHKGLLSNGGSVLGGWGYGVAAAQQHRAGHDHNDGFAGNRWGSALADLCRVHLCEQWMYAAPERARGCVACECSGSVLRRGHAE